MQYVRRFIPLLFVFCIFFTGCKDKPENIILTVASKTVHLPKDAINPSRYIVKYEGDQQWQLFYDGIAGFKYQEGFEYVLSVKVFKIRNPLADDGLYDYKLNYIISREEKESESIPDSWFNKDANY